MARARFGGRSYGGGYTWCPRVSNVYVGMSDDDDGPRLGYVERLMQLPLKERCHEISLHYARLMQKSDLVFAAEAKKLMGGCPEKYFDVDSVAAAYLDNI
ncbi:hypothetical protein ACJIZ3_002939 [Penstemon smallii]|uniref:Uncharacterized protein n=1 Tax=Penstemon smallii TaxID=265156 RepID=A0ABD3U9P5_9LAMI